MLFAVALASLGLAVDHFPVISRLVGGSWSNSHRVFRGLAFDPQEEKQRVARWSVDGDCCSVTLETGPDTSVTLNGRHIGDGVVQFDLAGAPFEYKFHQVGSDTLLVSRTAIGDGPAQRLDVGTIVLTGDDSCVQTIVNLDGDSLEKIEVIVGSRSGS